MPCGWEGNRRSGVALATCQILVVLHLWAQGLGGGDEHPPTISWLSMVNLFIIPWIMLGHNYLPIETCRDFWSKILIPNQQLSSTGGNLCSYDLKKENTHNANWHILDNSTLRRVQSPVWDILCGMTLDMCHREADRHRPCTTHSTICGQTATHMQHSETVSCKIQITWHVECEWHMNITRMWQVRWMYMYSLQTV